MDSSPRSLTRRGFLKALGIGAAGLALDPELLVWRPGAKTIFLPSVKTVRDPATGIAVRFIRHWDAVASRCVNRFDVLIGEAEIVSGAPFGQAIDVNRAIDGWRLESVKVERLASA